VLSVALKTLLLFLFILIQVPIKLLYFPSTHFFFADLNNGLQNVENTFLFILLRFMYKHNHQSQKPNKKHFFRRFFPQQVFKVHSISIY